MFNNSYLRYKYSVIILSGRIKTLLALSAVSQKSPSNHHESSEVFSKTINLKRNYINHSGYKKGLERTLQQ